MKNKHAELLPCLYCHGKGKLVEINTRSIANKYFVICANCFLQTDEYEDKITAISTWNKRANKYAEFLKKLKEYLNNELAETPEDNFGYANCCYHVLEKIQQFEEELSNEIPC